MLGTLENSVICPFIRRLLLFYSVYHSNTGKDTWSIRLLYRLGTGERYTVPVPEIIFTNPSPPATLERTPFPSNLV